MEEEITILYEQKIGKYRDYIINVLQKDHNSIDFIKIIQESYILCNGTEFFDFNIDDLSIEMINNIFNEIQCHDVHMVIFVELVSNQIRQTENLELLNQYNQRKTNNIVKI